MCCSGVVEKALLFGSCYSLDELESGDGNGGNTDRIRVRAENVYMPIPAPTRNLFSGCREQNAKYARVLPTTAKEALNLVSDYIQACIDNPDPDCFIVGGHRHIAHLDSDGFSWVEKPENSN